MGPVPTAKGRHGAEDEPPGEPTQTTGPTDVTTKFLFRVREKSKLLARWTVEKRHSFKDWTRALAEAPDCA